jgi:D-glycero-D-manno-heptose 1,7-bisphosphate phosphatase
MIVNQAVILAGGRGERLRPLTNSIPKPMAPVNGIPFLDYLIFSVISVGIDRILILLGYKSEVIAERYMSLSGVKIDYSFGTENEKTGRRLLNAYDQLDKHFLLMYGDNHWPIELDKMWSNYQNLNAPVTTTVFSNKNGTGEYDYKNNVVVGADNLVEKYDKAMQTDSGNGVDIGYFLVDKEALNPEIQSNVSFELDILPYLIVNKKLGAYVTDTQYYYITNMQTLKDFEIVVKEKNFLPLPQEYWK